MTLPTIPLRRGIVYGPVHSRRLGLSLGINLFPSGHKICPFDCVYCEYGLTTDLVAQVGRECVPSAAEVLDAVEASLQEVGKVGYITFSGHGEPTLHPDFAQIVAGVVTLRDRLQPEARVAVLSCSGVVSRPEVRAALSRVDDRIMKLDAGDEATFRAMNRPVPGLTLESIIAGLSQLEDVVIQHMVLDGSFSNASGIVRESWLLAVGRVRPKEIQIYSVDRPTAGVGVLKVPEETMDRLAAEVQSRTQVPTFAY
jgi:wyosine [tRNA(Phe)-imidazoG37] synthetase (radical SAM superfamily)